MRKMRINNILVGTLFVIAMQLVAPGQKADSSAAPRNDNVPLFEVGVTVDQLYSKVGAPERYFCVKKQKYVQRDQLDKASENDTCRPVFSRKTARNEYEIMLFLEEDASQSRLHPVQRVKEVRFRFDKDLLPAEAVRDIAEARELCNGGCEFKSYLNMFFAIPKEGNPKLMFLREPPGPISQSTPVAIMSFADIAL
jgi:hypothetical protein